MPSVAADYRHRAKTASPSGTVQWGDTTLKCYDLSEDGYTVTRATYEKATKYLHTLPPEDASAGFVILHRCGTSFHFLLLHLWRGNNEIWQAVHYADPPKAGFAPFPPAYTDAGQPRPTLCVWEMGIAAHEALVWQRYLASPRDAASFSTWQTDCLASEV